VKNNDGVERTAQERVSTKEEIIGGSRTREIRRHEGWPCWIIRLVTVRNLIGAGNLIGAAGFAEKLGDRVQNHRKLNLASISRRIEIEE
jgi:hypothetical protein